MCDAMVHRGPDDHGLRTDGPCVLGHRRLSIIDLRPEGAQPMTNEDDTIAVVVNGEIYNFIELRKDLEQRGHHFKSRSDSEVILHLYEEHGVDFLDHLRGMFAIGLWDGPRRRLVLARDRFGKKPLFYHAGPRGLVFASELGGLAASRYFEKRPDLDAIDAFITLQYVPSPMTAFEGVKKLPAGHRLVCEGGVIHEPEPYYSLRFDQPHVVGDVERLTQELRDTVEDAVRVRMVSDVPLGAFLSGGIDSSLIVALMALQSSQPVKTFSVGFTSKDRSELPYARLVAERYGTDHHEMIVEPDMTSVVPELVRHYGEPFETYGGCRGPCRRSSPARSPICLRHKPKRCATTASASCSPNPCASLVSPRRSRTKTAWRSTARRCASASRGTQSRWNSRACSASRARRTRSIASSTSTSRPI
jgi:asparagine synthase (glutamine-hydrolysing)